MKHVNAIPESFLAANVYDETSVMTEPVKSLLDCNPHKVSRKWRLIKKFEREMVCFDEARYMSDNFDEEILEIVIAMRESEQPLAAYLALLSMQGLSLEPEAMAGSTFAPTRDEFHKNMAIVMDLSFAIFTPA